MLEAITEQAGTKTGAKGPAVIPSSRDLAGHLNRFLKYWAGEAAEYRGQAPLGIPELPVELSVQLRGSVSGTLVLSVSRDFLDWLYSNRDYKTLHLSTSMEIFTEMTTLYCVFLIQQFWLSENFELGPILPRTSTPGQWPAREPNTTCRVRAGQNPVEIRLWMD